MQQRISIYFFVKKWYNACNQKSIHHYFNGSLMIIRPFAPGEWFGSIVIAGLFVTWLDTIHKIWKSNLELPFEKEKERYAIALIIMTGIGLIMLVFIIVNLIVHIEWLNSSVVLDEITLLALLLCLSQEVVVNSITCLIKNNFKDE